MLRSEAKKRAEKLKRIINLHRYLYHALDKEEISASALDSLKKELFDLEQEHPDLITPDSPTQRIGGKPLKEFKKLRHPTPMLSFNDAFSEQDMEDWQDRISKLLTREEQEKLDFYCELKIDGLAIELIYKDGILGTGSTRGDGRIGEDVTQNLKTIEAIPLRLREISEVLEDIKKKGFGGIYQALKNKKTLKEMLVRGEVFVSKKEFERVNKERKKAKEALFANPRNLAAGSIRQLDSRVAAKRKLNFIAYDLVLDLGQKVHGQEHEILKNFGFKTDPHSKLCKDLKEVFEFHQYWLKKRETLPYEIDGIVVQINDNEIFDKLGVVGKAPRGAVAYKFPLRQATTQIKDIKIQVGRTGTLTPVAILKPVEVGGVKISRATLHNEDEIKRLGVKISDTVIVGRAGDVIPEVLKVLSGLRTGKEKAFKFPSQCPACGSKIVKPKSEAIWRCPDPNCFARKRKYFYHFISRGAFDIVGLGPKIVDQLLEEGLVLDPADLFGLEEGDLIPLERFADKSAQNLVEAIQSRKKISLPRFIYGLGIHHVGEQTAIDLADYFGTFEKLKEASLGKLEEIPDIGPVVARSIYDWFRDKSNKAFLEKLTKAVKIQERVQKERPQKLKGKIFVFTGTLNSLRRDGAKSKVKALGGRVASAVSSQVDFVVLGESPGSKLQEAKKRGIKIINEAQFLKMLSQ